MNIVTRRHGIYIADIRKCLIKIDPLAKILGDANIIKIVKTDLKTFEKCPAAGGSITKDIKLSNEHCW